MIAMFQLFVMVKPIAQFYRNVFRSKVLRGFLGDSSDAQRCEWKSKFQLFVNHWLRGIDSMPLPQRVSLQGFLKDS